MTSTDGARDVSLDFGADPNHDPDPGIFKGNFLTLR